MAQKHRIRERAVEQNDPITSSIERAERQGPKAIQKPRPS